MRWIEDIWVRRSSLRRNLAMFWQLSYFILGSRDSDSHSDWLTIVFFSFLKKVSYNVKIIISNFLKYLITYPLTSKSFFLRTITSASNVWHFGQNKNVTFFSYVGVYNPASFHAQFHQFLTHNSQTFHNPKPPVFTSLKLQWQCCSTDEWKALGSQCFWVLNWRLVLSSMLLVKNIKDIFAFDFQI